MTLRYVSLDRASMKLYVFMDSGHNTNRDNTSQLGVLICLMDVDGNCHVLHCASAKYQLITRSMLPGGVH